MSAPRLVLDLQGCQDVRNGDRGIGRYVAGLAAALLRQPDAVAAMVLNPQLPFPGHLPAEILDSPLLHWNSVDAIEAAAAQGPIAYHLLSPFESGTPGPIAVPAHAVGEGAALLATLHDLIPLHAPEEHLPGAERRRYAQRLELVRSCDLLLCNSEHTRRDAIASLGVAAERCLAVGGGADARFRPAALGEDAMAAVRAALPAVQRRIVLLVGGDTPRKNTERLISAYALLPRSLREAHQLVVACGVHPDAAAAWRSHAARAGLRDGEMVLAGFVADPVLLALYQAATLVVMPSLDEGYGLPVAEAVACDAPVVTSNAGALPEILGMPESTFDPRDVGNMARVVERGLSDDGFRTKLREAGRHAAPENTWEAVAARTVAALQRLDGVRLPRRPRRSERRMRIAMVGPMPPVISGVADYNARIAAALGEHADLDVFVPPRLPHPPRGSSPRILPALALGESVDPAGYDVLLYTFGNSEHHLATYDLLHRFPGVLWLHDVRLGGFYFEYAHARMAQPVQWMREQLDATYRGRVLDVHSVDNPFQREWQHASGIFLTRALVRAAEAVLVNSAFAAQLCRLDQGPDSTPPPISTLPFAVPPPPSDPPPRDSDPPVILSAGAVDPIKAPERLVDALGAVAAQTPARLVFVGHVPEPYADELLQRAAALGVRDRVSFTGTTDEATWWQWMARATVVVQLRRLTNGETSAAIADAQACGTPVLTNMVNAPLDYPPGSVLAIDDLNPGPLEAGMLGLLTDRAAWEAQSRAGLAQAATSTFPHLADVLLARLDEVVRRRSAA